MYDYLVFIGRFQPFHKGHQLVVDTALSLSKNVIILVGGAGSARSARNPFTYEERKSMIETVYPAGSLIIQPINDHTYNDTAWISQVQKTVKRIVLGDKWTPNGMADYKIGLIGCEKDHTSYYLKMFPDWASEGVEFVNPINATALRKQFFEDEVPGHELGSVIDYRVVRWLERFKETKQFALQQAEYEYLRNYKKQYGEGPFLTADALVQVGGKILLITRGGEYGAGLLALPGGFVGKNEKFLDASIRELREETRVKVPDPVLRGSIKFRRVFDDPHRDARARLVTECFHISLMNEKGLPEIRGSDDAAHADWYDISELREELFFGDHYHMIKIMLGLS